MNLKSIIKKVDDIIKSKPEFCIILGSGLNNFCDQLENKKSISYKNINPSMESNIKGHVGEFVYGYLNNIPILCASGRLHYYEGYTMDEIGVIIKLFNYYKPKLYIITNSSGTVRQDWEIGDFMLTERIMDFSFIKTNTAKYYTLDDIYNNSIKKMAPKNLNLRLGTYTYTIGPTYETKEEIKEIRKIGGDIVGMSTFPEYLMCKKLKINPIILSCITNYAAGIKEYSIKHSHVIKNAEESKQNFKNLLNKIIINYV